MTVRCELIDYSDREHAYDNPRVVVTDADCESDMVLIYLADDKFGHQQVKVSGQELIEAVQRCMRAQWPY